MTERPDLSRSQKAAILVVALIVWTLYAWRFLGFGPETRRGMAAGNIPAASLR